MGRRYVQVVVQLIADDAISLPGVAMRIVDAILDQDDPDIEPGEVAARAEDFGPINIQANGFAVPWPKLRG